ncbi:hypothetical protein OUZ56_004635 [Daphnia magna]|uniref:Uncharacterized protein n=1 Tax=Daphnia magna TaxID=35525 RepID=A0ABQ9YQD5_9CRUS|nr:hypothetical protein OUZ56_004635 [Daphnia magna]
MDSRLIRHHEQELSITHKRKGAFQTADPSRYEKSSTTKGPSEKKRTARNEKLKLRDIRRSRRLDAGGLQLTDNFKTDLQSRVE